MKRLVAALLSLLLFAPIARAQDKLDEVAKSVVMLTHKNEPFCSGFVINAESDYVLGALHCMTEAQNRGWKDVKGDGKDFRIIQTYPAQDLIMVQAESDRPALLPRTKPTPIGLEVTGIGYSSGLRRLTFAPTVVLGLGPLHSSLVIVRTRGPAFSGGMSGGPVVDSDGKVVTIVQFGELDVLRSDGGTPVSIMLQVFGNHWKG